MGARKASVRASQEARAASHSWHICRELVGWAPVQRLKPPPLPGPVGSYGRVVAVVDFRHQLGY
jgi:hypothetical protein